MTTTLSKRRIAGQRFGLIELVEPREITGKNRLWLVRCHGCGKEYVRSSSFKSHTHSCGCQLKRQNSDSPNWKGVGDIPSTYISRVKTTAERRGILFNVSNEYLWNLYLKQDKKCALSGLPIVFGRSGRDENTASLDRRDSTLPYEEGNLQWVHKHINMMKLDHDQQYFILLCSRITAHQNKI